ncbi:DUF3300 domain-containing protein [Alloacidobacterium sp.]|uniref:DUF3300 domain-containing protein n=1 Tax=Alloacidobacterium sp. TaxID=2951999 RepID=UPI002D752732|nr:DUF3300 domain-containing protein [Alloacidobacterium sp.]HYK36591.1 DUF3300 domain-containing protein [Alloacidobacterium sp.]
MKLIWTGLKKILAHMLACLLVLATTPKDNAWSQSAQPEIPSSALSAGQNSSSYTGQGAPLTTQEINSLVSPIALYPDSLVAQILAAATFPDQIAVASYWLQQNKSLTGNSLMQAVDKQSWDPSVKALTQFPTVLNNLSQNLSWTSQLGDAYHNQQSEVMSAVQALRAQAKTAGNLKTTPQQTVTTESQNGQQVIVIQPANPQIVYVPTYNPTVVYGTTYSPPGYSTADLVATGLLSFGVGMAIGSMMGGGCCGWGYSSWNCNWYSHTTVYRGGAYYGNNAWHGGYYNGGYHPYNNYGYHNGGYRSNYNTGNQHFGNNNYNGRTNISGNTVNLNRGDTGAANSLDKSGWSNFDAARGWGSRDSGNQSTAFSGYGDHSGSSFGSGGWGDRTSSSRGWRSLGGGGGWGGGRFGGGGFRR